MASCKVSGFECAAPAVPRRAIRGPPTDEEWKMLRLPILRYKEHDHQGKPCKKHAWELVNWLRELNYVTTERQLMRFISKEWGVKTNLTADIREGVYDDLLQSQVNHQDYPKLDSTDVQKMIRDCKQKRKVAQDTRYQQLLEILNGMLDKTLLDSSGATSDTGAIIERSSVAEWSSDGSFPVVHVGGSPDLADTPSGPSTQYGFLVCTSSRRSTERSRRDSDYDSDTRAITAPSAAAAGAPLYRRPIHFNDKDKSAYRLLHLTDTYYELTLRDHSSAYWIHDDDTLRYNDERLYHFDANHLFWSHVRNALYFAKVNSDDLAEPELASALVLLPSVIQGEHFSLIKDLLATLSPVATQRCPALRKRILEAFRDAANVYLQSHHMLATICEILHTDQGDDSVSAIVLEAMLQRTRQTLPAIDSELPYLTFTLITFYRRNKMFDEAKNLADAAIKSQSALSGANDAFTRLALSERLYIYNDQNQQQEALDLAKDIVSRAQVDLGDKFPDSHAIYQLENLAETYDRLGQTRECIVTLQEAYTAARHTWKSCPSTTHISDKLQAMYIKERSST